MVGEFGGGCVATNDDSSSIYRARTNARLCQGYCFEFRAGIGGVYKYSSTDSINSGELTCQYSQEIGIRRAIS